MNNIRRYLFIHIHKTAGSTLQGILNRNFRRSSILNVPTLKSDTILSKISNDDFNRIRLIKGHFLYGIHHQRPGDSFDYFTVLRNPVDRVVSLYYQLKRSPGHFMYKEINERNLDLDGFVRSGMYELIENGQTRFISGQNPAFGHVTREMLETAKNNIDNFLFVGISERFDESLLVLSKRIKLKFPYYAVANSTRKAERDNVIRPETLQYIRSINQLDLELYEYALARFQREIDSYPGNLEADLLKLRKMNRWAERMVKIKRLFSRS